MGPLISAAALAARLDRPDGAGLVVLDATIVLPGERFDPETAFAEGHIPGARRHDIEAFSDPEGRLAHMVPSQGRYARLIEGLGVSNDSELVFYDQTGVACAARGWWLAGLFGHDRAQVLDGGLPAWREEGFRLEAGTPPAAAPGHFVPALRTRRLAGLGDMIELSRLASAGSPPAGTARLLDARSRGRYEAATPEPRPGLPGGHIPGAVSLPFTDLLVEGRRFRPPGELAERFAAAGVRPEGPVVMSCGSGLTASVLSLGLVLCGLEPGVLYDGSWTEWAQASLPRATGTAP